MLGSRVGAVAGAPRADAATAASEREPHVPGRWGFSHVPALDGLRGAAVVAVLLYHGDHLDGGYLGVDLFFVLSGYLITSLLLSEHAASGTIRLGTFWVRRIRRLVPALLVVLVGVALYAWLVAAPVDLDTIRDDGLATLFYVANWHTILRGVSYWDISLAPSPLQHTWSLAIEEQFYLVWPLVVVAVTRLGRAAAPQRLLRLCLALAALSAGLFVALPLLGTSTTRSYEGTDTRATALLLGAGWAAYRISRMTAPGHAGGPQRRGVLARASRRADVLAIGAAVCLGVAWVGLDGEGRLLYRGGLPLASLLATVVIAAVADGASPVVSRALSWAPLRGIGLISYGLYLWHWPLYLLITEARVGVGGVALLALRVAASFAVALLSYALVEQPIRHGALRGTRAAVALPASMAVAALVLVVATVGAVSPQGGLGSPTAAAAHIPGAPTVMFGGDSVALSLVTPVTEDPGAFGVNPVNATLLGCSVVAEGHPSRQIGRDGGSLDPVRCTERMVEVARETRPDLVVVLVGHRPGYELELDGGWARACEPAFDAEYADANGRLLAGLAETGAEVVAVATPYADPDAPFMPPEMGDMVDCINRSLARAADGVPAAHVLDLNELVCPGRACVAEIEGDPIRTDGLHFDQGAGGRRVAGWLVDHSLALAGLEPA